MTTSREALSAALDQAEAGTLETIHEAPIDTPAPQVDAIADESAAQRARDDQGRFAQKSANAPAPNQALNTSANNVPVETGLRKAPSSWKKDHWGRWDRLAKDPELAPLQEYIEQREQDYAKGVSTYKSQWDQAQPLLKAIEPFMPELQQSGITADRWVSNLGNAHKMLSMGSPEQKAQMFVKLASDYGVNLGALSGGQQNPQFGHIAQTVSMLQNKISQFESQAQQAEQRALQGTIDSFAATAPHFEVVKSTMGQLLASGMAEDLPSAYQKAVRLHDDVWQQEQASQASGANRQSELARKKVAASSPRSASPTGAMNSGGGKKSTHESVASAFDAVASGRF